MDERAKKRIGALTRRVFWQWLLTKLSKAAVLGAGLAILFLGVTFFVPIDRAWLWAVAGWFAFLLGALLLLVIRRPKAQALAVAMDTYGLKERLQTMEALAQEDTAFARLQRQETAEAVLEKSPKAWVPLRLPKKMWMLTGIGAVVCVLLCLLPNPQRGILEEREQVRVTMQAQAARVEAAMEEVAGNQALSSEEKAVLNERLKELAEELRKGKDYKEGIKKLSDTQKSVEDLKKEQSRKQLDDMKQALAKSEMEQVRQLGEKLNVESPETAKAALSELMEEDKEEERKAAAEALKQAAEEAENEATKEALEELAEALEGMDADAVEEAVDAALQSGSGNEGMVEVSDQLKLAKSQMSQLSATKSISGSLSGSKSGDGSGEGEGEGEGEGSGSGSGAGNGQGSGSGQGQGQGGGQGQGQGSGSGQGGAGGGQGQGAGAGTGALVEAEKIYDGNRLDVKGDNVELTGEIDENGPRGQGETNAGEGSLDGFIPYQQVVGEYGEEAVTASKRAQLPPAVQNWVEAYFAALNNE